MASHGILRWRNFAAAAGLLVLVALLLAYVAGNWAQASHTPNHQPADKVQVAAANDLRVSPGNNQLLLSERIRTANPTDLLLTLTAECGVGFLEDDQGSADFDDLRAQVNMRVEIDDQPVTVVGPPNDPPGNGNGTVEFCTRSWVDFTATGDDTDGNGDNIDILRNPGRSSHAFEWAKLNVDSGLHEVTVEADITETGDLDSEAFASIGSRTLTIEPVKMPRGQDKTIGTP
jgi:hypothetical protein